MPRKRKKKLWRSDLIHITGLNSEQVSAGIASHKDAWDDIVSISIGGSTSKDKTVLGHIVAFKKDGTVVAAGDNTFGQCNVSDWTGIAAISAGDYHIVGVKSDGTVLATQTGNRFKKSINEISTWQNIVAVSAGYGFTPGLRSDGTVSAVGLENEGQCDVDSWLNIAIRDKGMQDIEDRHFFCFSHFTCTAIIFAPESDPYGIHLLALSLVLCS